MTEEQRNLQPGSIDAVPATPGEVLSRARQAASLSRSRVAKELGLMESAVREIEENHFEKFAAGIYVRGYLRNYCKLLALDEQQLLDSFDQYCIDRGLADPPAQGIGRAMTADDRRRLLVGTIIGLVTLGGVFLLIWLANL
jgi:cytoskeleton protein RodZ